MSEGFVKLGALGDGHDFIRIRVNSERRDGHGFFDEILG